MLGLFLFTQGLLQRSFTHDPSPWWHHLVSWMVGVYLWALLTPAIVWLSEKFPLDRRNWPRRVALHLPASILITVLELLLEAAILFRLGVFPSIMKTFSATAAFLVMIGFHQGVLTYWVILAAEHGIRYYRGYQERKQSALRLELQATELQSQLARAQLSALQMQLHPHFLFNTLNAIMVLVRQQRAREAEEMLARLSDLLRCVLEDVEAHEVPLRRELEYLQLYLSIEQVRFADRLQVEISADPATLDAAVPHLGLQPIVENAIRHGLGKSAAAGRIRISAARVNDTLEVTVQDDGPGLVNGAAGRRIGLPNTRARLHQLYGEAAHLELANGSQGGAVATMVLPYRLAHGNLQTEWMELNGLERVDRG